MENFLEDVENLQNVFNFEVKQGTLANNNGQTLENKVKHELLKYNIYSSSYGAFNNNNDSEFLEGNYRGLLLSQVPHITLYGGWGRHDFSLYGLFPGDVRIECRSQGSSGSVDEKLPYLFETSKIADERVVWIILDGSGFKSGAKSWLKQNADSVKHKKIKVFESFTTWKNWINVVLHLKDTPVSTSNTEK